MQCHENLPHFNLELFSLHTVNRQLLTNVNTHYTHLYPQQYPLVHPPKLEDNHIVLVELQTSSCVSEILVPHRPAATCNQESTNELWFVQPHLLATYRQYKYINGRNINCQLNYDRFLIKISIESLIDCITHTSKQHVYQINQQSVNE